MATATAARPAAAPKPRTAPPDRRAAVLVPRGRCPMGASCGCCPAATESAHSRGSQRCGQSHPGTDRVCSLPCPAEIPPCTERDTLPAAATTLPIACCVECGRVTARRWTDPATSTILPWCAGAVPEAAA
jgi:hypothetical protein